MWPKVALLPSLTIFDQSTLKIKLINVIIMTYFICEPHKCDPKNGKQQILPLMQINNSAQLLNTINVFNNVHNKKIKRPILGHMITKQFEHSILANFDNKHKIKNENIPTLCKFAKTLKANIQAIIKSM
jgi:hypothetical protein